MTQLTPHFRGWKVHLVYDSCILKWVGLSVQVLLGHCCKRKDLLNQTFRECAQILHGGFYLGRPGLQLYHCYTTPVQSVATGRSNYQMTHFNASLSALSKSRSEGLLWANVALSFLTFVSDKNWSKSLKPTIDSLFEQFLVKTLVLIFIGCMGHKVGYQFNSIFIHLIPKKNVFGWLEI